MEATLMKSLAWEGGAKFAKGQQAFEMLPTWQQGVPQDPGVDYLNLIRRGYAAHALIHACISLLASSAAVPRTIVTRADEEAPAHRLAQLLARPNSFQTELEFRHLLMTHLLVSGNAYVDIGQRSTVGLVQEMGLIRPDRMLINPGPTREEDVFEIRINGVLKRSIDARDIIHFKLPNPDNDFYGLSPIVVAQRETNLDIDLTLLEDAFYRNAGVPFGMMLIKGRRADADEKKTIKTAWKRAFNRTSTGVRKFFELLVINSAEAEYKQLGVPVKDLEAPATRDQMETRICMPFRVPPAMAGALVGLKESQSYASYEVVERTFWRYGVAYFLEMVRQRWVLELVPEFATPGERLNVKYDLASVPALAEDNVDKLKVAATAVDSGGWTPNQAAQLVGLGQVDGGDFYVRKLLHIIDTAPVPPPGTRVLAPGAGTTTTALSTEEGAEGGAVAGSASRRPAGSVKMLTAGELKQATLVDVVQTVRARAVAAVAPQLETYFADQARDVVANLRALVPEEERCATHPQDGKAFCDRCIGSVEAANAARNQGRDKIRGVGANDIMPADALAKLQALIAGEYAVIDEAMYEVLAPLLGVSEPYTAANPVMDSLLQQGSGRVVQIDAATRAALNDVLALAEERGYSLLQAANGVPADGFPGVANTVEQMYANRHLAIARTEAAFATNAASKERYTLAGVGEVDIIDGDDDDPCASRNETRQPVIGGDTELAHPNCTLVLLPVVV